MISIQQEDMDLSPRLFLQITVERAYKIENCTTVRTGTTDLIQ